MGRTILRAHDETRDIESAEECEVLAASSKMRITNSVGSGGKGQEECMVFERVSECDTAKNGFLRSRAVSDSAKICPTRLYRQHCKMQSFED